MDPRHKLRTQIVQELYSINFSKQKKLNEKTLAIIKIMDKINGQIEKHAPKFPLPKIAKVDLAILQLAVYELLYEKTEPHKVVINEAVELAREMGSDKAFAFVNAVLGKVYDESISKSRD